MNPIEVNKALSTHLNDYVLAEEIGRGAHGIVYKAFHQDRPNEALAVKVIDSTGNLDVLLVEPEILSRLQHPNIVKLLDYFLYAGKLVLVMEYIDGVDLQTYLHQRGHLSSVEVRDFLIQIGKALSHAHNSDIIHRDIKLNNILVIEEENRKRYVLVDFGVSRMAFGVQTSSHVAGTYTYMAPEQIRGRPIKQSDLWALGIIAYTLLTGVRPFGGNSFEEFITKVYYEIPKFPSEITGEVDFQLENIIYHLLEKQWVNRTSSATELLNELSSLSVMNVPLLEEKAVTKHTTPSWEREYSKNRKKDWVLFWLLAFLATLPNGVIGSAISMGGAYLFFTGQQLRKHRLWYTIGGLGLVILGFRLIMFTLGYLQWTQIEIVSMILFLVRTGFSLLAASQLVKMKQREREALLLRALRMGGSQPTKLIGLLREFVDLYLGNINVHQKYAEALLFYGQTKEAVVEAKCILDIDPYNFGATLLLAHGYFDLGLYGECDAVCNHYLAASGYSFEFSDLKSLCSTQKGSDQ